MVDIEKDIPVLEFCSLRQALDWIFFKRKPIPLNKEKLLRTDIKKYGFNLGNQKIKEFTALLFADKFTIFAKKGFMDNDGQSFGKVEFTANSERQKVELKDSGFGFFDWDNNYIYKTFDTKYDFMGNANEIHGLPADAIGEIEIPFKEIKDAFPEELQRIDYLDSFELIYEDGIFSILVNGKNSFEVKRLKNGPTKIKSLLEYIIKHPNKLLKDIEMKDVAGMEKWNAKVDRIDETIRNALPDKTILTNCFPVLSTHEVKFTPKFTLPSISNMDLEIEF